MMDDGFLSHVLKWVQNNKAPGAVKLDSVSGYGTDWDGDTEGGFYSRFSVDITYRTADDAKHSLDVEGEDMGSLWEWVVNRPTTNEETQ